MSRCPRPCPPALPFIRFITFEEDEAVEKVFAAGSMQELGGKRVEIKQATPKGTGGGGMGGGGGGGAAGPRGAGPGGVEQRGAGGGGRGPGYGGRGGGLAGVPFGQVPYGYSMYSFPPGAPAAPAPPSSSPPLGLAEREGLRREPGSLQDCLCPCCSLGCRAAAARSCALRLRPCTCLPLCWGWLEHPCRRQPPASQPSLPSSAPALRCPQA